MFARHQFPTTGNRLFAGKLAGRGLLAIPGFFSRKRRGRSKTPKLIADNTPTFHCPEWPGCGCPGGTMRPECPGLKARVGVKS